MAGTSVTDKRTAFRKLHESGCFVVFDSFSGAVPHAELNAFLCDDLLRRQKP